MTLKPGYVLNNRYVIVSVLGQGGMGAVYRARDEHLKVYVAVKENLYLSEDYSRQFQREASILAGLRHPNLPRVGDYFGIPNQGQYLIMEHVDGEDLRQRIERLTTLPEQETVLIGVSMCDGLGYLHSRHPPIIHRDIKPGNIKITPEGEIILVDFGLAKIMSGAQATTTGARAMTPGYSPPEQYGTARTDARTDIYSLGATLYAALTGIIPEDGLARATRKSKLTPLRQLQPRLDKRLTSVIEKALEIEPDDRYQSAEEFKIALLEAGDLLDITRPRFFITPPPVQSEPSIGEISPRQPQYYALDNNQGLPPGTSPRSKVKKLPRRALTISLIAFALIAAYILGRPLISANNGLIPPPKPSITSSPVITQTLPLDHPLSATTPAKTSPALQPTPIEEFPFKPVVPTPIGGGRGSITFVSERTGSNQLWSVNLDGYILDQLTNIVGGVCQPVWSPDGEKIAVISPCSSKKFLYNDSKIYILDKDGNNPMMLPVSKPGDFHPAWSPDGNRIAFTSIRTGTPHVYIYDFDTDNISEISDTRFSDMMPTWNRTGKQLAIVRKILYNHIWMVSDTGVSQFQFSSSGNVNDLWPDWSSDGSFLIYSRSSEIAFYPFLYRYNYEERGTGAEIRIPPVNIESGPIAEAKLSPDMKWITFESWPDGKNHDVYIMDITGENKHRLTTDPGFDFSPVWQPKGKINSSD